MGILSFNYTAQYNFISIIDFKNILMINNVISCGMAFSDIVNNSWNISLDSIQILENQILKSIMYIEGITLGNVFVTSMINFSNNVIGLGIKQKIIGYFLKIFLRRFSNCNKWFEFCFI